MKSKADSWSYDILKHTHTHLEYVVCVHTLYIFHRIEMKTGGKSQISVVFDLKSLWTENYTLKI